jgi:hypothetical protein
MHKCQIPIGNLPINLILWADSEIEFIRAPKFKTIIDQKLDGVSAIFDTESFSIGNYPDLVYNVKYNYKEMKDILLWLQQQNLDQPQFM